MKKILKSIIAILVLAFLAAPFAAASELVIATAEEIEGTDIQQIEWENIVHALVYTPPVRFNKDMSKIVPGFASDWKLSKDGKTMTLTIAKGMTFSNGMPMTPAAIKASYERYLKISPYATDLEALDKITTSGDKVIMHWKAPPIPALVSLASSYGGVVATDAVKKVSPEAFNRQAIAYGAMSVDEWVQGSHITLKRNPNYRTYFSEVKNKGPIRVDKVTVRFIPDDFTRVTEILSGSVDIIYQVPLENVEELKADRDIVLHSYLQPGCVLFYVNPEAPNLTDVRVRRALQRGVNRAELVAVLANNAQQRHGIFSPSMAGFQQAAEDSFARKYGFDPNAAKALLDEAGWKDTNGDGIRDKGGKKLTMTAMIGLDYPSAKKTAPVIQAQYKKIGVQLNLREYEGKYIKQAVRDKRFDLGSRRFVWPDGDMLTYLFHTDSGNYSYPPVDALINKGRYETDPAKRAAIYAEAQELVLEMGLAIPLVSNINYVAVRKDVTGFSLAVDGTGILNDLQKK